MTQLAQLVRPIPKRLIEAAPQGKSGEYVPHFVIAQALLSTVGAYDWQLVEILRGPVPETTTKKGDKWPALPNAIVGAVYRLTVEVDGRRVSIEEAGSCEAAAFENNDGERLKKAASDALKRCAMRLGVAIHLWCKRPDQFFVHRLLAEDEADKHEVVVGGEKSDEEAGEPGHDATTATETGSGQAQAAGVVSDAVVRADILNRLLLDYKGIRAAEAKRLLAKHFVEATESGLDGAVERLLTLVAADPERPFA